MNRVIHTMSVLGLVMIDALTPGCSRAAASSAPEGAAPEARVEEPVIEAKADAPVEVISTASARSGRVDVTLTVRALADIPRGVARVVVPDGVTVVSGAREIDFGAIPSSAVRELKLTLDVPATPQFHIFSGADVYLTAHVLLHKGATPLSLGQP
jgi:hypothetical protein